MPKKALSAYKETQLVGNRLAKRFLKAALSALLIPMDYTRTREIPVLLESSGILSRQQERLKILDIGSPQIFSLTLCHLSPLWEVHYINAHQPELADLSYKGSLMGLDNLKVRFGDITSLGSCPELETYDYIFSCSVWEHISPEESGDITASSNVYQLLHPGGRFAFSVPYYRHAFNEYVSGDVYAVKGTESEKTFFQRFYDESALRQRIVEPSGMAPYDMRYLGERFYFRSTISKRMTTLVGQGNRRWLLGRFFKTISDVFMVESDDAGSLKKPYLAICTLSKPHESLGGSLP